MLPSGTAGQEYKFQVKVKGGSAPYSYSATGLPKGLSLDSTSGAISGVPLEQQSPALFSVSVKDKNGASNSFAFALPIQPAAIQLDTSNIASAASITLDNGGPSATQQEPQAPQPAMQNQQGQAASAKPAAGGATFTLTPDSSSKTIASSPLTFTITGGGCSGDIALSTDGLPAGVTGTLKPTSISGSATSTLTLTTDMTLAEAANFSVTGKCGDTTKTLALTLIGPIGTLTRAMLGLEQSGASSSSATDKLFFDIFHSHPLGKPDAKSGPFGSANRLWGLVRIGTTPIQTTAAISSLPSNLTTQAKALTLNQLAQSGEFQLGYERQLHALKGGPFASLIHDKEWTSFGFLVGGGATLPFDPKSQVLAFDLPATGPGRDRFNSQYPGYASITGTQVAFTTPDRNQFFRQYFGGFRLTTLFEETDSDQTVYHPVGTVTFTLGQNEAVSGGRLRGVVAQAEGFYPIPIGIGNKSLSGFYLFGRASFQLNSAVQFAPLLLNQSATQPTDFSAITVIPRASQRDLYAIGIGIDAFRFAKNLFGAATSTKSSSNSNK